MRENYNWLILFGTCIVIAILNMFLICDDKIIMASSLVSLLIAVVRTITAFICPLKESRSKTLYAQEFDNVTILLDSNI